MVEVTFTVNPRIRRIAAHDPDTMPMWDYARQIFWGSGIDLPTENFDELIEEITLDAVELLPGSKAILSLQLPPTSSLCSNPSRMRRASSTSKANRHGSARTCRWCSTTCDRRRGRWSCGQDRSGCNWRTKHHAVRCPAFGSPTTGCMSLLGRRKRFLTAKRLLSNQTFRDIYRTDTLDIDQRLKITSLTFLFTDLKGSTELYERVGDLVAFDLVREHFRVLHEIVAAESGAVIKTIGDAVMATFPTPDRALAAALRMRHAMRALNDAHGREDLLLKIGIHEGPCLAVTFNERQDYFGQTVNIASRVQGLAVSQSILATASVVDHPQSTDLLERNGQKPMMQSQALRGMTSEVAVYEIP